MIKGQVKYRLHVELIPGGFRSTPPQVLNLSRLRPSYFTLLSQETVKFGREGRFPPDLFPDIQPSNDSVDRPIQGRVDLCLCNCIEMRLFDFGLLRRTRHKYSLFFAKAHMQEASCYSSQFCWIAFSTVAILS